MNMKKEPLGFLRLSRIVKKKTVTHLKLGTVVYPYAMVALQWHSVTQSAA